MIQNLTGRLGRMKKQFKEDSLFRNAVYLVLSTAIMGGLGFVFWLLVAHWYKPGDVGLASALISATTLLSSLSLIGLNAGLIRFISSSKNKSSDFNAAAILVVGVSAFLACGYLLVAPRLGIKMSLIDSLWEQTAFVILIPIVAINSLTDAVFIGSRKGEFHTLGYTTFSVVKLILPLFLIKYDSMGIFAAYALAMTASLTISYYLMIRHLGFRLLVMPNWHLLAEVWSYSANNYIGVVLSNLPFQLLPLLIIRRLGAAQVAYFAMAQTIANLLYVVPVAACQSLLAESAHDPKQQTKHIFRAAKILSGILVPLVIIAYIGAPYLLSLFGGQYSKFSTVVFRMLDLATFFLAISTLGNTVLNIEKRTKAVVLTQLTFLITTGVASFSLIHKGLSGIGIALLTGFGVSGLTSILIYIYYHRGKRSLHKTERFSNSNTVIIWLKRHLNTGLAE